MFSSSSFLSLLLFMFIYIYQCNSLNNNQDNILNDNWIYHLSNIHICPNVYVYDTGINYYGLYGYNYQQYIQSNIDFPYGDKCSLHNEYETHQYNIVNILLYRLKTSNRCKLITNLQQSQHNTDNNNNNNYIHNYNNNNQQQPLLYFIPMYPGPNTMEQWKLLCSKNILNPYPNDLIYLNESTSFYHFFIIGKSFIFGCDGKILIILL